MTTTMPQTRLYSLSFCSNELSTLPIPLEIMSDWSLDHIVIVGSNLEQEVRDFQQNLQTKPIIGGKHSSLGTRNALIGVAGSKTYIELLCPDPERKECLGNEMLSLHGAGLALTPYHYAIKTSDLEGVRSKAIALGMQPTKVEEMSRTTARGNTLKWKTLFIRGHKLGGMVPFFIDWGSTQHPTDSLDNGSETGSACLSAKVVVAGPSNLTSKVKALLSGFDKVEYEENDTPGIYFPIGISGMEGGLITLRGFQPEGIDFEESKSRIFEWTAH